MLNKISAKELNLSINISIEKYYQRILEIKVEGFLNKISYSNKFFEWFMEDLVFFLDKNDFKKRWDYEKIILKNIESLKLSSEELKKLKLDFKRITSWDMEIK